MNGILFGIGVLVWLIAAFAVVRVILAWIAVANAAPQGQRVHTALALGRWDFSEVVSVAGEAVNPAVSRFRGAVKLFLLCLIPFFGLILLNVLSGSAA